MEDKEVLMLKTMQANSILSDYTCAKLIYKIHDGGKEELFVKNLIYKVWNRKFVFIKKYEEVLSKEVDYIMNKYRRSIAKNKILPEHPPERFDRVPKNVVRMTNDDYCDLKKVVEFRVVCAKQYDTVPSIDRARYLHSLLEGFNNFFDYKFFKTEFRRRDGEYPNGRVTYNIVWDRWYPMKFRYLRKIGDVSLKKQLIWNLERIICILTGWVRELCYAPGQPMFSYNLVVHDRDLSPVPPPRRAQEEPRLLYDSDTELVPVTRRQGRRLMFDQLP